MSNLKQAGKFAIRLLHHTIRLVLKMLAYFATLFAAEKRSQIPPANDQNLVMPAIKLSQQIRSGHVTAEEVLDSYINRINSVNPLINAVVDKRFEQARREAREIDRKINDALNGIGDKSILTSKPLLGVPISIKETIGVDGYAFTGGLLARRFVKAPKNSDAVELVMNAGMIPIALTNIPELAMWWDSSNRLYGRTNNPYDLSRIPGGSSGGEAALLSAMGSVVGLGNDIAGSIRMPAHFCGIFGHKPTPFVVSNEGTIPLIKGEKQKLLGLGPLVRYASDLVPMMKILAGPQASKLRLDEPVDLSELKIYYLEELGDPLSAPCEPEILAGIRNAICLLETKFNLKKAEKVKFEEFNHGMLLWAAEANTDPDTKPFTNQLKGISKNDEMNPFLELGKKAIGLSAHTSNSILASIMEKASPGYGTRANRSLTRQAANLRKRFNEMLGDTGILLVPTHPEPAPKHHTTFLKLFNVTYTSVVTVLQAPITQCPLGLTKRDSLPYGVQIIATPYNDRLSLAVALELEAALGGWIPPCEVNV